MIKAHELEGMRLASLRPNLMPMEDQQRLVKEVAHLQYQVCKLALCHTGHTPTCIHAHTGHEMGCSCEDCTYMRKNR